MKFNWNQKYNTIALYSAIVVFASMLFAVFLFNIDYVGAFIKTIVKLLMPFVYGFCLAYILNPIVKWLEQKVFPKIIGDKLSPVGKRALSVFLAIIFGFAVVGAFFSIIGPQLVQSIVTIVGQIPQYINNAEKLVGTIFERFGSDKLFLNALGNLTASIESFATEWSAKIPEIINNTITTTISITTGILSGIIKILVGIIISIYLLFAKEKFFAQIKKVMYALFPNNFVDMVTEITHNSNRIFSGFISGKLLDSLIIGAICFVGMNLMGLEYAVLISVIIGITNVIPYFGPFIGAIPSCLFLLLIKPIDALIFAIFIIILQQVDGNIIGPKILGDSTGLSAIWVIFSITLFGGLWGFVGMFIGVPLFAVIYSLIKQVIEYKLYKKGKPVATLSYVSPEHPIPTKKKR